MNNNFGMWSALFILATFSTFFVTAVNAYTLTLGYPLWRSISPADFRTVHAEYLRRLNSVITIPHILMFFSCGALVVVRSFLLPPSRAIALCVLTWSVVAVSAFVAGPIHNRFTSQGTTDAPGMRALMRISLARTLMMAAASAVLLSTLATLVRLVAQCPLRSL